MLPPLPVITTTLPSGGTKISATTSEGQLLRTTGTAVVAEYHHYEPLVAGGMRKTTYSGTDTGPRWMTTEYDAAHRIARVLQPAFGGATSETVYGYDSGCPCGKPSLVTTSGRPATVNQYNAVNDLVRTGLTGDNLTLELNSTTDRIQETETTVELSGSLLWEVRSSAVYDQPGSATPKTVATSRRLLAGFTGLETSISESLDVVGNVTRTVSELDRTTHVEVTEQTRPGASDAQTRTLYAGRVVLEHQPGSSGDVAYTLDDLGRVVEAQHPGHVHAQSTDYVMGANLVASHTDATGASTTYTYVPQGQAGAGQVQSVTAPDSGVTTNQYDLLGRVIRTSGARVYPVGYTYNLQGQMETMTTWQDYAGLTGAAVTTWGYESATGLLVSKTDAAAQSVTYTYDVASRLATRTWARGVVTTYGYDPIMTDLDSIEYSDGTPAIEYGYDRLGRPTVITTDLVAQTEFTYRTDNLLPDTEVVQQDLDGNGTVDFQRTFVRQYDGLLRSTGYLLKSAPTTTEQSVTYGYEAVAGRYASVATQTLSGTVNTFTYSYDAARPRLLVTVTGPAHTVTNTWEADRDILDTKTNTETAGSTIVSKFDYTVNNIGQRSGVATTGSAFASSSGWTWGYDALGQVTSAAHASNTALNQGYDYDDIGNRIQSSVGLSSPAVTNYTANMLNQYATITGASAPAVNPSYDADGNQLAGAAGQALGQTFEWDGENRLKVVKDSLGNVLVTYGYDAQSRRIRRTTGTGSTLYVYEGWNCVSEHTVPTSSTTTTLSRTLAWGLDLSGSLQGAGGVGGLLNVVDVGGATVVYPAYDGNGNVCEYLDATGAVVAHFEYDAFGRIVWTTGTSTGLDIRFSTKPQDDVTGWHYYGYRFYDAEVGRWTNRDPIGEEGGLNLYVQVGNDTVGLIDLFGLKVSKSNCNALETSMPSFKIPYTSFGTKVGWGVSGGISAELKGKFKGEVCDVCCDGEKRTITTGIWSIDFKGSADLKGGFHIPTVPIGFGWEIQGFAGLKGSGAVTGSAQVEVGKNPCSGETDWGIPINITLEGSVWAGGEAKAKKKGFFGEVEYTLGEISGKLKVTKSNIAYLVKCSDSTCWGEDFQSQGSDWKLSGEVKACAGPLCYTKNF